MYYMRIMRLILIITIVLLSSCSSKYKGAHTDYKKFKKDIEFCLQKSCIYKTKKVLENLSIISLRLLTEVVEVEAVEVFNKIKFLIKYSTFVYKKKDTQRMITVILNYPI